MTLLELLVAVSIFSIIAAAGYSALEQGIAVKSRLDDRRAHWVQLETAIGMLEKELGQVVDRAPRTPGILKNVSFQGHRDAGRSPDGEFLRFTLGGRQSYRSNPASPYTRVAYQLRDGVLYRVAWPRLDAPFGVQGKETEILDEVESIRLRFLQSAKKWVQNWNRDIYNPDVEGLPAALELTLTLDNNNTYQRYFHVGHPR